MDNRKRAKIPPELIEAGLMAAQKVFHGEMTRSEAQAQLMERFGLPSRTVDGYWQCYLSLREGTKFRHTIAEEGWRYNLQHIEAQSPASLMLALETFMEHIVYLKGNTPGLYKVHSEFATRLRDIVQFDEASMALEGQVRKAYRDPPEARARRLRCAPTKPEQQIVFARTYRRNPDVIVEVLLRANGKCEGCEQPAPFRRPDGRPFLEVHHRQPLADNGDDTVENAIALCPNCHRERHYGVGYAQTDEESRVETAPAAQGLSKAGG